SFSPRIASVMFHAKAKCYRRGNQLLAINFVFLVHKVKEFRPRAEKAFRVSNHQKACRVKCVVEDGNHPSLQGWTHVDENVAAADKVHPRKRGIVKNILGSKDAQVPDRFADLESLFRLIEESTQPRRRDVGADGVFIVTGAGPLDG